ncbi:hypothetical protein BD626DRAFT_474518 [Schizophyllum amplum]|uniref:Uncharacterized protein n=1 Tax=Schizophyllum amplum TaxID=97359 RepID=A0A550CXP4_9AGAR|nr:hypothetical protein BD626DRAFT_474518 [Auriculariopsis ampla]
MLRYKFVRGHPPTTIDLPAIARFVWPVASIMSHRSSPTPFGPSRTRAVSPDLTDEDMHEAYPFDYFLAPRRPHACCMRCTNELQPFDFDDGDSSRETYINLPSPSANYRIILDIVVRRPLIVLWSVR